MILVVNGKKIDLLGVYSYLYPYLIRFSLKNGISIEWKDGIIYVSEKNRDNLLFYLELALRDLLNDCYVEPSHKNRSKHPSRYQKIIFDDKQYVLNYRTDIVGIVGYGLNYLISEIS